MQVTIADFSLRRFSKLCPACNSMFNTLCLETMPDIRRDTVIEADLHRVLPDSLIRASLLAACPACDYTSWSTAFQPHAIKPEVIPPSPNISDTKKFAQAILTGRHNKADSLDLALLALNGMWCAREAGESDERWLSLAQSELTKALADESWYGDRPYYQYLMGEIARQAGDWQTALDHFELCEPRVRLPKELVERQRVLAVSGDRSHSILPPHLVEALFCQSLEAGINSPTAG